MHRPHALHRIAAALLFTLCCWTHAAPKDVKARVVGLSVARIRPDDKFKRSLASGLQPGTRVYIQVKSDKLRFASIIEEKSKLMSFVDDKSTKLAEPGMAGGFDDWLGAFPKFSDDRKSLTFCVETKKRPTSGATKARLRLMMSLRCGSEQVEFKQKVALKTGTRFNIGDTPVEIKKVKDGGNGSNVTFECPGGLKRFMQLKFLDDGGKEIPQRGSSWSNNTTTIMLGKKAEHATITLQYFKDVKVETIPISVIARLGI